LQRVQPDQYGNYQARKGSIVQIKWGTLIAWSD
jgi:hypothetical protein